MKCIYIFSALSCSGLQIDNVGNPSWQAQIKGTKKWTLEPPPECALVCDPKLEVTVHPGEISMLFSLVFDLLTELKLSLWSLVGGAVASWLVRSTPERAVRVRALTGDIVLCSWARHFTLTVPLSTQVYKWVPANLMLGGNPAMD